MKLKNGFSLVELLVVVAIIGVLAGVGIVGYDRYVENTKQKVFEQNVSTILRAIDFEYTVVANKLSSAMNEVDSTGTATGNKVNADSTCETFNFSIKEHFKDFKNPWFPTKKMITIDTQNQASHKKGQVHITCQRSLGFLTGWNCKVQDSLFHVIVYYKDGSEQAGSGATDTNNLQGGERKTSDTVYSKWYNKGYTNPPVADRWNSSFPWLTTTAGQALCGATGFTRSAISVSTNAAY